MKNKYLHEEKEILIKDINELQGYQGYVQFSHRPIEKSKDIFLDNNPKIEDEEGFIYEAHFCNGKESIAIRQINDGWFLSKTDISNIDKNDMQEFITDISDFNYKVKMAQIWEKVEDDLCENMKVKKLKKVVFAGFVNG
jgi:CRISPR type III-associated protein (TIGR04423 family)